MYRLGQFISPTFSTPPQTHTSDRLIFEISFDSENLGKFMRHSVAISFDYENSGKFMRYYVAISFIFAS